VIVVNADSLTVADFGTETKHQEKPRAVLEETDHVDHVTNSKQMVSVVLEMTADFPTTLTHHHKEIMDSKEEITAVMAAREVEVTAVTLVGMVETVAQRFATNSEIQVTVTLVITANSAMKPAVTKEEIIKRFECLG